ncbi:glycosyltransferase family 1 protein [candidate division KSB1 bacterium]|nr:MAG: glycosyltransferase family 1 protein [candidate division KSB1 bacterium]
MKVKPLATLEVIPSLPAAISGLKNLAYNILWSWNPDITALFRSLDPELWETVGRNPARMLREISQRRLDDAARNPSILDHYNRCISYLEHYMREPSWFDKVCGPSSKAKEIVYFSMEYGMTENLPVYSGGLGVLSGDHLKSASDLGLPLVGIGLAYRQGYFQQQLTGDGFQTELYPENDFTTLPVSPVKDKDGELIKIPLQFPGRMVYIGAWKVQVGRVSLFLLDTDQPENSPADRRITYMLYGGDKETRIQQEIVLGIGGVELVSRIGIETTVCHMNEGHSAFIQLARIIRARQQLGLSPEEAVALISGGTVFTTHTPVPAGIDQFPADLMDRYLGPLFAQTGFSRDEFLGMGSKQAGVPGQLFNMAIFALRTSDYTNGVSRLHADVSRGLWEDSWPHLPHDEIPIDYVTNGIHIRTWISDNMTALYDRYLGPEWRRNPDHKDIWAKVREIPDEDLWNAHLCGREQLVDFCRQRIAEYRTRTTGTDVSVEDVSNLLDPRILTIGFARRFATYKRATLLLRYPDRLLALLRDPQRPIQIVFAGKAHPQDDAGKALIRDIIYFARSQGVEHRLIFVENYDMAVARHLVQGVDIWLNTPRRPLEASGTSGMKVLPNGGINMSILDGWWDEGYTQNVGWAIGRGRAITDEKAQDDWDAQSLYDLLERHVVPLYYTYDDGKIPRRWIARMKESIAELVPRFNSNRMVKEYCEDAYSPALGRCHELADKNCAAAKQLAAWKTLVRKNWESVKITSIKTGDARSIAPGSELDIAATVSLGPLTPNDIEVQVYFGPLRSDGSIAFSGCESLEPDPRSDGTLYRGRVVFPDSGRYGYTVRIMPYHPLLGNALKMGLVHWASVSISTQ